MKNQLKTIADKYKKFGIDEKQLEKIYLSGLKKGFSDIASIAGIKLALSMEYKQTEYFSIEEVQECTGETKEDIYQMLKDKGINPLTIQYDTNMISAIQKFIDEKDEGKQ